ncbi:MAG: TonB-dependent receptor plug domain-containing protein, partial [Halieaceae bacterium]
MNRNSRWTLSSAVALAVAAVIPSTAAVAQESATLEEVVVTARKRSESLQEIPVAVSVFGADDILMTDMRDLEDVALHTPGFQFMNQGNQQPGRYNTQLQFRGLTTAQFSPSFATGALFIDGVYVLNGGTSLSLMDLERVEVIKGPQSAYYARNTFGGAVNLITRDPNSESFGGELNASMSERGRTDISGLIEGPIIKDVLAFSVSGRYYDKEGHYTATDGGRTGDEETTTFNGVINWTPTDNFKLKMRYSTSEDDDGAPSQGFISGIMNDTCTGTTVNSAEGPANPVNYICGKIPYGAGVVTDPGNKVISSNTILPADMAALTDPSTNIDGVPNVTSIGLQRETERFTIAAGYQFDSGYSID